VNAPKHPKMFAILNWCFIAVTAIAALLPAAWHDWTLSGSFALFGTFVALMHLRRSSGHRKISSAKSRDPSRLASADLPVSVSPRRLAIETACGVTIAFGLIFSGAGVLTLGLAGLGFASLVGVVEFFLAKRRFKSLRAASGDNWPRDG
jgi:hypothetical protein